MPAPVLWITADGVDITPNLVGAGVITVTITDSEGMKADTLAIEIDNVDASVVAPRKGVRLGAIGGYDDRFRDFGTFVVDSVVYSGWPQKIDIQAKSVEATSMAKQRDTKSYKVENFPTFGDIFQDVAGKVGLSLNIAPSLQSIANVFEAKADEDALEFVTRIGEKIGASVSIKAGSLVVVEKGEGTSASGGELDQIVVAPGLNLLNYQVTKSDEAKHGEVEATYYDRATNELKAETTSTGMTGPKFQLRQPYQDKSEAGRVAKAQAKALRRMEGDANFMIEGDPFAQAEAMASVTGIHPDVDGLWRVQTVTHTFSSSGPYTTSLACSAPSSGIEASSSSASTAPTTTGRAAGPV